MTRPSPLPNRVAPDGALHAAAARGTLMGNRGGRLHRADGTLSARWRSRAWIACETAFRGRQRQVWGAGYSELFFLDEPTALAAGHRPCFECRRAEALAFAAACGLRRAGEIDRVLHAERLGPRDRVPFGALPDAAIFASAGGFFLRAGNDARAWSFGGYGPARSFAAEERVDAVTPALARRALAAGYRPRLHPSAVS